MMSRTSSRVQLEVAFLDDGETAPEPAPSASPDERPQVTVLVVAVEPDVRRYVRECLRERADLRVVDAASVAAATEIAARELPDLLVVDEPERGVLAALAAVRAVVMVDDIPRNAPAPRDGLRQLARPFTAETLLAEVEVLLGTTEGGRSDAR